MSEIFLDTETTGLSHHDGDRIVEIACIETKDLIPTKKIFHKLINPEKKVSQEFLGFIDGKKLIIHNAPFDIGFLNSELKKVNKKLLDIKKVEDTLSLARSKFPASSNSLDNLCKRFNIDISRRIKHNALLDCELLREVYINLVDQKEPSLSFNTNDNTEKAKSSNISVMNREKIIVNLDPEEIKKHNQFLKSYLKKNSL